MQEIVDSTGGPILQVFLIEPAVLPEVLAKVQEDAAATLLDVDLVPADRVRAVVHGDGGHRELWIYFRIDTTFIL